MSLFKKAVYYVKNSPSKDSSSETKLKYYKYYKQATAGNVQGSQPWAVQLEARAKWDAWNSVKGLSKEEAKKEYIKLVVLDNANWENHSTMINYPN